MRILEVRDGFIKFEAKNADLSSFVQVDDTANSYIAQVIQIKRAGENFIAYAKILFLYNGAFNKYDNSMPSLEAEIKDFDFTQFDKTFNAKNTIKVGNFIKMNEPINIDKDNLNKKTLICFDTSEYNKIVISNIAKQFEKSTIIDTLGIFDSRKFVAGVDFKLPLNTEALQFLFEDCLNDATSDSKSLIKEIFQDLADYSKTVPFVPFGALKTIVDEMVDKSHVFKLLVLKNKLAKFDKLGYFAATQSEAENLKNILLAKNPVIDLSKLDVIFQNRYLEILLSTIEKLNPSTQVLINVSNSLDKKNLKTILKGNLSTILATHSRFKYINEIKPMFANYLVEPTFAAKEIFKTYAMFLNAMQKDTYLVVGEGTQYIPLISSLVESNEIEPTVLETELSDAEVIDLEEALELDSETVAENQESISAIEKKSEDLIEKVAEEVLAENETSEMTLFEDDNNELEDNVDLEEETNVENTDSAIVEIEDSNTNENCIIEEYIPEEYHTQVDEIQAIEIPEDISELAEESEILDINTEELVEPAESVEIEEESMDLLEVHVEDTTEVEQSAEEITFREYSEELDALPEVQSYMSSEDDIEAFEEIVELDDSDIEEADVVVELEDENIDQLEENELDKAIVEDVDKVFTTMKEDSISDSDLDFIDELNNSVDEEIEPIALPEGMEELSDLEQNEEVEEGFLEPLEEVSDFEQGETDEKEILEKRNSSTPIVPVYGADIPPEDMVMSDDIEQGDTVVHAKYGNGVVEKMIKYGTKTLFSINFDNVGRRLLDPTLTEIKKS